MKFDIRNLEKPIAALETRWAKVPRIIKKLSLPIGFIGLLAVTGMVILKVARGYLFDMWNSFTNKSAPER